MVGGQVVDIASEGRGDVRLANVIAIHRRKTGALIRSSLRAGAIAGGATPQQLERLTAYGDAIGLAFQIADDILDETAASDVTGKRGGGDRKRGKATYPSVLGLDAARARARRAEADAKRALRSFGDRGAALAALASHVVGRAA
jgi:geranylgeranyl pyrophosphate synthase